MCAVLRVCCNEWQGETDWFFHHVPDKDALLKEHHLLSLIFLAINYTAHLMPKEQIRVQLKSNHGRRDGKNRQGPSPRAPHKSQKEKSKKYLPWPSAWLLGATWMTLSVNTTQDCMRDVMRPEFRVRVCEQWRGTREHPLLHPLHPNRYESEREMSICVGSSPANNQAQTRDHACKHFRD